MAWFCRAAFVNIFVALPVLIEHQEEDVGHRHARMDLTSCRKGIMDAGTGPEHNTSAKNKDQQQNGSEWSYAQPSFFCLS